MNYYQIRNMPQYAKYILFLKHLTSRVTDPIGKLLKLTKALNGDVIRS